LLPQRHNAARGLPYKTPFGLRTNLSLRPLIYINEILTNTKRQLFVQRQVLYIRTRNDITYLKRNEKSNAIASVGFMGRQSGHLARDPLFHGHPQGVPKVNVPYFLLKTHYTYSNVLPSRS